MTVESLYGFVFRGEMAQEALDRAGRRAKDVDSDYEKLDSALSVSLLDDAVVAACNRMARVFVAIGAFENTVRNLIENTLLEAVGEQWWVQCVSDRTRKKVEGRMKAEESKRFHTQRGARLLDYTDFGDLSPIFINNWSHFEDLVNSDLEWVKSIFSSVEQTRNVVMHGGQVDRHDVQRVGMAVRDWVRQVGA